VIKIVVEVASVKSAAVPVLSFAHGHTAAAINELNVVSVTAVSGDGR
jgi:hypothetical protein